MIIETDANNKIQQPVMIKTKTELRKLGIKGNIVNFISRIYKKPTANIKLNGRTLNAFSRTTKQQKKDALSLHSCSTQFWKL